ncbi:MAG: alpha/beta fold hydrolase [Desulfuromonadaceae bacterium]|nr:alpha/beta fold hydrolase [Desulfuromonadaceae bacterium]
MFFEGVDIDSRFGTAISAAESLTSSRIRHDIFSVQQINFDDQLPSLQSMRREATSLMYRFMSNIYSMTTVNHDHLFASLLRALPCSRISEEDFRRRVFLLTDLVPDKTLVFCHQSLEIGQVALLTDDRYHKYRDFLALARETGVVRYEKGFLLRNTGNLTAGKEFHRIRIENPLGVAANEVRPLTGLKRQVRWMAWLPEMLIRHRVVDVLLRQAAEQYKTDYSRYFQPGDSKTRDVGEPILLKGSSRRLGVVLIHGFLASPREVFELAKQLHNKGCWVYCVRLRGHGTSPEDLSTRSGIDWIESVDIGYALMSALCAKVVVGGFSFGGGMALDSAARIEGISAVFSVCPPFRLHNISSRFAGAATSWNHLMNSLHFPGITKEYVKNNSENPQINYSRVPVAALSEMVNFMKEVEARLATIRVPTLVIQAQGDPVVNAESTALMFNRIGAKEKRYVPFDLHRHGILAGEGSDKVQRAIAEFIDTV